MFAKRKDKAPFEAQVFPGGEAVTPSSQPGTDESQAGKGIEGLAGSSEEKTSGTAPLPPAKKKPTGRGTWALRWLLSLLLVFALGAVVALFLLYLPARQQVTQANADVAQAQTRITELESRVASLQGLETTNQEVKSQAEQANLHVALLKAQVDATRAQLALAKNDVSGAQLALSKTPQTVNGIKALLPEGQQGVVNTLQQRLDLVVQEIKAIKDPAKDSFAAQSDLEVFSTSLAQLEATLFAR